MPRSCISRSRAAATPAGTSIELRRNGTRANTSCDGLREATDVVIDGAALRTEVLVQGRRLDGMISGNDEHAKMIEQLEQIYDASDDVVDVIEGGPSLEMRSGDELAAELEQFLRDQD